MNLRSEMLIAGRWEPGAEPLPVINRDDGSVVANVGQAQTHQVLEALNHAKEGLTIMRRLPASERARILSEAAKRVQERSEYFAKLIAQEGVKTIREARKEVRRCVLTLQASARVAEDLTSGAVALPGNPSSASGMWTRRSGGIVAAITPFNDPLNLVAHKVGPAIATGSPIVLKPDERTPLSAIALAEELVKSGLPSQGLQVLHGTGAEVGAMLVKSDLVRVISFTGGLQTGRRIATQAGLKVLHMELGGVCPTIVAEDSVLDTAIPKIVSGALWAGGQNCLHVQRLLVHKKHYDRVLDALVTQFRAAVAGPKSDERTDVGPLIDEAAVTRVQALVGGSIGQGATLYVGGSRTENGYRPTLLSTGEQGRALIKEEVFGPVTQIEPFEQLEEALASAARTGPALQAGLFTDSHKFIEACRLELEVGALIVNDSSDYRVDTMPFGGPGTSGIGREGVAFTAQAFTEPQLVCYPN